MLTFYALYLSKITLKYDTIWYVNLNVRVAIPILVKHKGI